MKTLMKENYGNLKSIVELGKSKQNTFTIEQLLDEQLKNEEGENRIEVRNRMEKAFFRVLDENIGKNIAIISHGAAIKFLIMKWCKLNKNNQLEFNKKIITLNSPGIIKLVFRDKELIELDQLI